MPPTLSPEDYATLAALLRDTIAADRFPLSPRVRRWKAMLDKLEPPAPKPSGFGLRGTIAAASRRARPRANLGIG